MCEGLESSRKDPRSVWTGTERAGKYHGQEKLWGGGWPPRLLQGCRCLAELSPPQNPARARSRCDQGSLCVRESTQTRTHAHVPYPNTWQRSAAPPYKLGALPGRTNTACKRRSPLPRGTTRCWWQTATPWLGLFSCPLFLRHPKACSVGCSPRWCLRMGPSAAGEAGTLGTREAELRLDAFPPRALLASPGAQHSQAPCQRDHKSQKLHPTDPVGVSAPARGLQERGAGWLSLHGAVAVCLQQGLGLRTPAWQRGVWGAAPVARPRGSPAKGSHFGSGSLSVSPVWSLTAAPRWEAPKAGCRAGQLGSPSPLPAPTSMSPAERLMWLCHSLSPHSLFPALLPRGSAQGTGPNPGGLWGQDGAPSIPLLLPVPTSPSPGHLATLIHLKQTLEPIIQPCLPLPPPQTDGG